MELPKSSILKKGALTMGVFSHDQRPSVYWTTLLKTSFWGQPNRVPKVIVAGPESGN